MAGEIKSPGLSVRIRKQREVKTGSSFLLDVAFEIPAGITILFGPSGAGKSTLLDCLAGLLRPDSGHIAVRDVVLFNSETRVNLSPQSRHVSYVFQDLALFPHMTVRENVSYGLHAIEKAKRTARVSEILEAFRIDTLVARRPDEISGGERQRVALARALVTLPGLLLLDEPLGGLDVPLKLAIIADLRKWNVAQAIPIIFVTHNRDEVDALGERVIALHHGKIAAVGTAQEVLDAPRRSPLAQAAGFENLIAGVVKELREADGVMRVLLNNSSCEIEVPLGHETPGAAVQIAVRAGDILLSAGRPQGLSARNVIPGKIVSLERQSSRAIARVDCGAIFTVHITPGAVRELQLAVEKEIWLVIKTHSCHIVED